MLMLLATNRLLVGVEAQLCAAEGNPAESQTPVADVG